MDNNLTGYGEIWAEGREEPGIVEGRSWAPSEDLSASQFAGDLAMMLEEDSTTLEEERLPQSARLQATRQQFAASSGVSTKDVVAYGDSLLTGSHAFPGYYPPNHDPPSFAHSFASTSRDPLPPSISRTARPNSVPSTGTRSKQYHSNTLPEADNVRKPRAIYTPAEAKERRRIQEAGRAARNRQVAKDNQRIAGQLSARVDELEKQRDTWKDRAEQAEKRVVELELLLALVQGGTTSQPQ